MGGVKWLPGHLKRAPGAVTLGTKWGLGGQNQGLERSGTSKLESWTAWMAVSRAQRPVGQPS